MPGNNSFKAPYGSRGNGVVWGILAGAIVAAILLVGGLITLQALEWFYYDAPPSVWVQGQRRGVTGVDVPPPLAPSPEEPQPALGVEPAPEVAPQPLPEATTSSPAPTGATPAAEPTATPAAEPTATPAAEPTATPAAEAPAGD